MAPLLFDEQMSTRTTIPLVDGAGLSVPPEVGELVAALPEGVPTLLAREVLMAPLSEMDAPTMCPDGPVTVTVEDSAPEEYL